MNADVKYRITFTEAETTYLVQVRGTVVNRMTSFEGILSVEDALARLDRDIATYRLPTATRVETRDLRTSPPTWGVARGEP